MSSNKNDIENELIELNIKIGEAEKQRQEDFLKGVLADDLIFRRASGKVVNKVEYLADLVNPDNKYEYLISEDVQPTVFDVQPTVYEDVVTVSLLVRAKGQLETKEFEGVYRNIRIFLKNENKGWQCVVWFNTVIQSK
jgi:hypothetical protein